MAKKVHMLTMMDFFISKNLKLNPNQKNVQRAQSKMRISTIRYPKKKKQTNTIVKKMETWQKKKKKRTRMKIKSKNLLKKLREFFTMYFIFIFIFMSFYPISKFSRFFFLFLFFFLSGFY